MSALTSAKYLRCEPCQQLQKINQIKNALVEKSKERFEKQSEVIDESITIPGEVWKYPDYETYKTKQNA